MLDRGQDSHFIDRILFFLLRQVIQADLFKSIYMPVCDSFDFVDLTISTIT